MPAPIDIKMLQKYYSGFYIDMPVGNNAFSYIKRNNQRIFVPSIMEGSLSSLEMGDEIVFSEIVDGREINCRGLKNFIHWQRPGQDIFIFDNHNHAFFFWVYCLNEQKIKRGTCLVHVDQHRDTREPNYFLKDFDIEKAFHYTNFELNVGNFIQPVLDLKIFTGVKHVGSLSAFDDPIPDHYALDLDMDIFSKEMAYINYAFKIKRIQEYIDKADVITIATSPLFMDQGEAIKIIKGELFSAVE